MNTLSITQLTCGYHDNTILQDLNLVLEQQEIVCLLGSSGCGKTTLLKAIAGLLPLRAGKIMLAGNDLTTTPLEQRQIGFIFQDYALFPHLTVAENIIFGLHQKNRQQQQAILAEMVKLVHLQGLEQRYPHQLSGGQQQRVAIARALACEPKLLLLDEPFSNIDSQVRYQMIEEIRAILKQQAVPAIFVTHSKEEAFVFADKLALMDQGKIIQFGTPYELYHRPNSRFVAEFLGKVNYLPCQRQADRLVSPFTYFDLTQVSVANEQVLQEKQHYRVLIRPEDIALHLWEKEIPTQLSSPMTAYATVEQCIFLGGFYRYQLKLWNLTATNDEQFIVVHHQQKYSLGSQVQLLFRPKTFIVFNE
ncbi:ABC transporter ATP-binding protein [Gallibacterium trehalosifermentans]|uniref:ABC transporter ATP-binding protein n=1 Tax=Gallibacterium trehalosifermentans TaxID=516935 RepID=A0ABV6H0C0_9PAST